MGSNSLSLASFVLGLFVPHLSVSYVLARGSVDIGLVTTLDIRDGHTPAW